MTADEKVKRKLMESWLKDPEAIEYYDSLSEKEMVKEMTYTLTKLMKSINNWASRDTLLKFTKWNFWKDGELVSIDIETANKIVDALFNYLKSISRDKDKLIRLYEAVQYQNHKGRI